VALSPPRPLSDFFGSLAASAGPGGHPVDDKILPYNRSRDCRASEGRGKEWAHLNPRIVVSQIARLGSAAALRCGALRSFISSCLRIAGDGVMSDLDPSLFSRRSTMFADCGGSHRADPQSRARGRPNAVVRSARERRDRVLEARGDVDHRRPLLKRADDSA
jgi:hypothetical protein